MVVDRNVGRRSRLEILVLAIVREILNPCANIIAFDKKIQTKKERLLVIDMEELGDGYKWSIELLFRLLVLKYINNTLALTICRVYSLRQEDGVVMEDGRC